jgi:hypothetical protein
VNNLINKLCASLGCSGWGDNFPVSKEKYDCCQYEDMHQRFKRWIFMLEEPSEKNFKTSMVSLNWVNRYNQDEVRLMIKI